MGAARRKKIATAWHEAGHIVVGTHFGFRLIRASMEPRDMGKGEVSRGSTEWEPAGSGNVMPLICMSLAGQAVEQKLYDGTICDDAYRDDQAVIQAYAWICAARKGEYVPDASVIPRLIAVYREQPDRVPTKVKALATELINQAMPATVQMLSDHWSDVERVATLLLKNTTVTPDLLPRTLIQ
jgi:hypothetical protein